MLDNISGSESAVFDHIIHYFDGYFGHFFRTKIEDLFEIGVIVGHPKNPESAVIVLLDH